MMVVHHLPGRNDWSTVVVNGTRQIPKGILQWDAARSIPTTFSRKIGTKTIQAKRPGTSNTGLANGTRIFHSEIPFGNFGLPFKKSRFPEKISVQGDKINLSIYIPSEISGFWG